VKLAYKFSSTSFLTVDEKSRLLIPAEIRRKLDQTQDTDVFVIKIGKNGKPWMYPERYYDAKVFNEDANLEIDDIDPTPEQLERMLNRSADIYRVPMDKQGRILLPESVMELTRTGRDVALLGVFNHLQLWNRDDYAKRQLEKQNASQSEGGM
jgi:MraZ protein